MKASLRNSLTLATVLAVCAGPATCSAQLFGRGPVQTAGYETQTGADESPSGVLPASPLAGGAAAAYGGTFANVHGDSIVMPAQYAESCPPGYGGYGGAYGESAYVDFGGYGEDQIGPHYFDIMAGTVWLTSEDAFSGVGAFGSIGVDGPRILNADEALDEYDPGWHIAVRADIGPLSVLEAAYMGLYDIGFSDTVRSVDVAPGNQDFQLFSAPGFGLPTPIPGLDDGSVYSLTYDADLQSTEFTYRRYWVGNMPRVSGTMLAGFRYVRLTENLNFTAEALADQILLTTDTTSVIWDGENDLLGFQVGGDGWIGLRQGLRVGVEGKAGVYNNRFVFNHSADFAPTAGAPTDFNLTTKGNDVAFVGECVASIVADILPSISIRGGYRVLYMDRIASVGSNLDMTSLSAQVAGNPGGDALFHGFDGSIEYVW